MKNFKQKSVKVKGKINYMGQVMEIRKLSRFIFLKKDIEKFRQQRETFES